MQKKKMFSGKIKLLSNQMPELSTKKDINLHIPQHLEQEYEQKTIMSNVIY